MTVSAWTQFESLISAKLNVNRNNREVKSAFPNSRPSASSGATFLNDVALAEREACELVTADTRLLANLKPKFPFIIDLASRP